MWLALKSRCQRRRYLPHGFRCWRPRSGRWRYGAGTSSTKNTSPTASCCRLSTATSLVWEHGALSRRPCGGQMGVAAPIAGCLVDILARWPGSEGRQRRGYVKWSHVFSLLRYVCAPPVWRCGRLSFGFSRSARHRGASAADTSSAQLAGHLPPAWCCAGLCATPDRRAGSLPCSSRNTPSKGRAREFSRLAHIETAAQPARPPPPSGEASVLADLLPFSLAAWRWWSRPVVVHRTRSAMRLDRAQGCRSRGDGGIGDLPRARDRRTFAATA